jgi:hypothetical protein
MVGLHRRLPPSPRLRRDRSARQHGEANRADLSHRSLDEGGNSSQKRHAGYGVIPVDTPPSDSTVFDVSSGQKGTCRRPRPTAGSLIHKAIINNIPAFALQAKNLPQIHRLLSLPEIHGGGCADVLRYVQRPPTKKIRQNRRTRRAKKTKTKTAWHRHQQSERFCHAHFR